MPTYEYVCRSCAHEFEEFQSMTARPLRRCPECGRPALERKIGLGAGILFKGGGFYETDYRSESYKKAADADTKPSKAEPDKGHTHTGTCACGKKPAGECGGGGAGPAPEPKKRKKPAGAG